MSTPYALHCSVCNADYFSKSKFLYHLTSDNHQGLARQECLLEWSKPDVKVKELCLVVFASFPVTRISGGSHRIIHYFSRGVGNFVTDFVFFEDRPRIAILQLESLNVIEKMVSNTHHTELSVDSKRVQVRRAVDLSDLEWAAVLPEYDVTSAQCVAQDVRKLNGHVLEENKTVVEAQTPLTPLDSASAGETVRDMTRKRPLETPEEAEDSNPAGETCHPKRVKNNEVVVPRIRNEFKLAISDLDAHADRCHWRRPTYEFKQASNKGRKLFCCSLTLNGVIYKSDDSYRTQREAKHAVAVKCLKELIAEAKQTIPDSSQGNKLHENVSDTSLPEPVFARLEISSRASSDSLEYQFWCLRKSVTIPDEEYDTVVEITNNLKTIFRKNDSLAEVVLFRNWHLKLRNSMWPNNNQLLYYVYSKRSQADFPSSFTWLPDATVSKVFSTQKAQEQFLVLEALNSSCLDSIGGKYQYRPTRLDFTLITFKRYFVEMQICRLLEYMCTFDPRCHSVITMAYFWAQVNGVTFADFEVHNRNTHQSLPEPHTLEWLVMHFFCNKKLIPTVRQIQERPHQIVNERFLGMDVGFHADKEFSKEWKFNLKTKDPTIPNDDSPTREEFITSALELFQEFLEFYGHTLSKDCWILNTRDGEVISVDKFIASDPGSCWSTNMTSMELAGLRLLQKSKMNNFVQNEESVEADPVVATYKRCNYKVNFKEWNLYMVHPFVFTWKFTISKELPAVLDLMDKSAKQLKKYLNMRKSNGILSAKKRFGTLINVLKI